MTAPAAAAANRPVNQWLPYEQVHGKKHTVVGTVLVWPELASKELGRSREICVYLPPSLVADRAAGRESKRRYPVIYFHDGQNMFDDPPSYVGEWEADETLEELSKEGIEAIAVAIPNAHSGRFEEYSPWRGQSIRPKDGIVGGKGDAYLEWLVTEVKPLVDRSFPTAGEREATGTMGSSLGGLISLYAMAKYPDVFGLFGAMSPAIRWHDYAIVKLAEEGKMPRARLYMDMGGREWKGGFDDCRRFRDALLDAGWRESDISYVEDRYAIHRESAWAKRLPDALRFLLSPPR
jgi:predicted alpha/beta superfamily hydrolase